MLSNQLDTSDVLSVGLPGYKWLTVLREIERAERRVTKDIPKKRMLVELRLQIEASLMESK